VNLNVFTGLGLNQFTTDYTNVEQRGGSDRNFASGSYENDLAANLDFGVGIAFRISPKFNIALEHTVTTVLGPGGDMLDADENVSSNVTTFRDFLHYPHLSLNFNLGGSKNGVKRSEPLYWANALTTTGEAIAALEARPVYDPTDSDGDGIIDMIDQEKESPAGARVDTRGVAADSDNDKVPDYKDKEPYSPPGYTVNADGVAQVPKALTEADVNRIVDAKLAAFKVPEPKGINNWFLPMVNFDNNSYALKYSEYEKLYQVAQVLKQNPTVKLVATGHTDNTGSEGYNNVLSYNRANAAIEFLTSQHGISRDRIILNYAGEASSLVPVKGSNRSNRRVEFKVASGETEQARPEGKAGTGGSFKGNKDAGY
jgi:outer membrane protein OmpA-like peptidoglycan-associated protein